MTCKCNTVFTCLLSQKIVCYYCGKTKPEVKESDIDLLLVKLDEAPAPCAIKENCATCLMTPCACKEEAWAKYEDGYGWIPSINCDGNMPSYISSLEKAQKCHPKIPIGKPGDSGYHYLKYYKP